MADICNNYVTDKTFDTLREEGIVLDRELMDEIIDSQSEYTAASIKSGYFESITWVYLGKFTANHKSVQNLNKNKVRHFNKDGTRKQKK